MALPGALVLKAQALHLADRLLKLLRQSTRAEAIAERFEHGSFSAELHRLRGVFLAAMGAEESQIETSFAATIRIAHEQKSVSLERGARATYAEYSRQKASGAGGRGFPRNGWLRSVYSRAE